jgi:hypothetical protein
MLLLVILNDCVAFFWVSGAALDQNRLILHFCCPVVIVVVVVDDVLIVSMLLWGHSSF